VMASNFGMLLVGTKVCSMPKFRTDRATASSIKRKIMPYDVARVLTSVHLSRVSPYVMAPRA